MKNNPFAGLPPAVNDFSIEFLSNREVTVEGSRGVLSYSEEMIRVNADRMTLCFSGRNLNLKCISPSALVISGYITKLEFES